MLKFVQHPRCPDIKILASEIVYKNKYTHITISSKYDGILLNDVKFLLKKVQHRSYYRAIYFLSFISNLEQRNFILHILNSISSYLQNNYDINIAKLWINTISIKKHPKVNRLIIRKKAIKQLEVSYYFNIELGFVPKLIPKKD